MYERENGDLIQLPLNNFLPVALNNAPVVTAAATELYISSVPLAFSIAVFTLQYMRAAKDHYVF